MKKVETKYSTSIGPSMYPTLQSGDGLRLNKKFPFSKLQIGDIIIFKHPERDFNIVHRISKKTVSGYLTRGDNNTKYDPYVITEELYIGRVYAFKRGDRIFNIHGGFPGFIFHKLMIFRMHTYVPIKAILKFIYKKSAASGLFYWVNGTIIKPKVIYIKKNNIRQPNLVLKGRVIGFRNLKNGRWYLKFPYRYFINKNNLEFLFPDVSDNKEDRP